MIPATILLLSSLILLASGQLPLPSNQSSQIQQPEAQQEPLECWEIVGYLKRLNRFYSRKCSRMGKRCPGNYPYAIQWFEQAGNMLDSACGCIAEDNKVATP